MATLQFLYDPTLQVVYDPSDGQCVVDDQYHASTLHMDVRVSLFYQLINKIHLIINFKVFLQ